MKLLARYLKPFVGILLVCLVLLFGQAACDLSLPTLMSDMVNVGIQQSGLEAGAPEAMRQEGLQLLSAFAGEEDRSLLEGGYYTIEPGSSEAQRFAEDYPLVREEAVCVLREGQAQEELDALEGAYDRASYAMLLYFQQAAESGDLEQAAQNLAQGQLPTVEAPLPDGQTGLGGSQESFPQGALPEESSQAESDAGAPTLYSSQGDSAGEVDSTAAQEPVENTAPAGETSQEGGSGLDMSQGLESVSLEQLYQVIPLMAYVPQEGLQQAQEQAAASDSMMGEQVGVTLARLFYEELGMDTAAIQSRYIWNKGSADAGRGLAGRHRHGAGGLFLRADGRRRGPPAASRFVRQGGGASPTGSSTGSPPPP